MSNPTIRLSTALLCCFFTFSCAVLHHVQVGNQDYKNLSKKTPFSFKVSEVGLDLRQAKAVAQAVTRGKVRDGAGSVADTLEYFQMGPRTGDPVYIEDYDQRVSALLAESCPSGKVSNLIAVRETRKYPVISGEIVKISGYCENDRESSHD